MKLIGALYLENNLTPRAFTSDRIAVLELLASQARFRWRTPICMQACNAAKLTSPKAKA